MVGYHTRWVLDQVPEGSFHPETEVLVVGEDAQEAPMEASGVAGLAALAVVEEEQVLELPDLPVS